MTAPRAILIIGCSRGIGLQLVQQALDLFPTATVFATARNPAKSSDLQLLADNNKGRVELIAADANDANSLHAAAVRIQELTNVLDVVIYNAGVLKGFGNILEVGIDGLKENIDTNLYGAYYAAVEFSPFIIRSEYTKKSLVFLSSDFGSFGFSDQLLALHQADFGVTYDPTALYNISKTALNRLGKELDIVLRPQGVPVLLVHPGLVKTSMNPGGKITAVESATGIMKVVHSFKAGDRMFVDWKGDEVAW